MQIFYKKRGGGYWTWKHHFLFNLLRDIPDGDVALIVMPVRDQFNEKYKRYLAYLMLKDSIF